MPAIYDAETRDIQFALTGDAMITRRMQAFREEGFLKLVKLLRDADATFANLEMLFHDYEGSYGFQGGTYTRSDPRNLAELKWMGVDLVSAANNHSFDFGETGLRLTLEHCREADLPAAGAGRSLDEARAPAYFDSPRGRVAVMAATSTFAEHSRAGPGRPDFPGRFGVNALRWQATYHVDKDTFQALRRADQELGFRAQREHQRSFGFQGHVAEEQEGELNFLGQRFVLSDRFRVETAPNPRDLEGIARWIRGARKQADWVFYSLHSHEQGADRTLPAAFVRQFARWCIDQGCSLFVGHGPHFLRGIEIYKGCPIFYSLGNFIFQNETVPWLPQEAYERFGLGFEDTPGDLLEARSQGGRRGFPAERIYWESVVAVCDFAGGKLKEVRLHPIDLGFGRPIPQRGRPVAAHPEVGQQVLRWLQEVSKPFGTDIGLVDGIGVIRP